MEPAKFAAAVLVWSVATACAAAEPEPRRIEEAFSQDRFDRALWTADRVGARLDPGGGQLRIVFPRGPLGRLPAALKARFRIEGDFDARVPYAIASWRRPKKHAINLEIFAEGPDGMATVTRTSHSEVGSGYSFWHGPADSARTGAWKQEATDDTSGWLRLQRTGGDLRFFVSGPGTPKFRQLGAVSYGTAPITGLTFRLSVPQTDSPVVAAFGKIEIEAERVIEPPRPVAPMVGPRFWLGAGVALVAAGGFGAWLWRRARGPARRAAKGGPIRLLAPICLATLIPSSAWAGMPSPLPSDVAQVLRLTESAHARYEAISFFLVVLFASAALVRCLWNSVARDCSKVPRITYGKSLALVVLWGLLFLVVLTMIAATREMMTPGVWEKKGLLYQVTSSPQAPSDADGSSERREHLRQLQAALWQYAAQHKGRLPPAGDPAIAAALWEVPGGAGMRYLRTSAPSIGNSSAVIVYEPGLFGQDRLALRASGEIVLLSGDDLHRQLEPGR